MVVKESTEHQRLGLYYKGILIMTIIVAPKVAPIKLSLLL